MPDRLSFRDNHGTVNFVSRNGRPTKNPKESLGQPRTIRLYDSEEQAIKDIQFEYNLNRNEVIQKCIQVGVGAFEFLDWISHNLDTVKTLAERYHRKKESV